jgi:hypothetical protein
LAFRASINAGLILYQPTRRASRGITLRVTPVS